MCAVGELLAALSVAQEQPPDCGQPEAADALDRLECAVMACPPAQLDDFDRANIDLARVRLRRRLGLACGDCLNEALVLARRLDADEEDQRLLVQVLLEAAADARLRGSFREARGFLDEAVECAESVLGPAHPDTAEAYNCLGLWGRYRGDFEVARAAYGTALEVLERASDAGRRADVLHNLASLEHLAGNAATALVLIDAALRLRPDGAGQHDADEGVRAVVLTDLGRYGAAADIYRSLEQRLQRRWGAGSAELMHLDANWAVLEQRQGDFDAARRRYGRAIESAERLRAPNVADIYANAAHLAYTCGQRRTAAEYADRAVAGLQGWASEDLPSLQLARQVLNALES